MRTLLENLEEDERCPVLADPNGIKWGGRYIVNDIGQAIAEIKKLQAAAFLDRVVLNAIADMEPGSRGAYSKFAAAVDLAKSRIGRK